MKKFQLFFGVLILSYASLFNPVFAQSKDKTLFDLAKQAEADEAYDIAIEYYEELFRNTNSDSYYNSLLELYPKANQLKEGEKTIKKRIKTFPQRSELWVDLGHFYELQNEEKDAQKSFEKAIDLIDANSSQTRVLANRFRQYEKYVFQEQVYLVGRKRNNDPSLFQFELAIAYAELGKTEDMIQEYLTILGSNSGYIQTVQNLFQRYLYPDPEGKQMEMLREQILRKIQKEPTKDIYSELLIWLYIQDKNFNGAFIQAKALDRRLNENGKRLYSLAQLSLANKAFEVAQQCYEYVVGLDENSPYSLSAKMQLVKVMKLKTLNQDYQTEDLNLLKAKYISTLTDLGKSSFTYPLMMDLAELEAFYLDQVDTAIAQYEEIIQISGISNQEKAQAKLNLADLLLIENEIWDASLLYSQVEKDFKYDQLGEIAKLKNAKVAYYTGDFYWSQAQLDVLKGSTSKLIANDAMSLSLTITDNIGLDSIAEPLEMYARADLWRFKKDYAAANKTLDSIPQFFPASSLKDDILFIKYEMEYAQRNYDSSAVYLRKLLADFADDILGDDALFHLAKLEEEKLNSSEKAMELYKQLITTYPASIHVVESRKRFRFLRGDEIENTEELN
ncbi:MAG: hypothetical protein DWP98_10225 [Bacteroidetes bacterium]|nr:MAG: hypothetical protein DWP98_10225 [Bacteroidota bacterium]MBL1143927.1 hypothetical protein [Bacteroidota bacterium]MCB0802366.1 hypothetical protein [Flavobacteriales bacterium]NOG56728.1 hypothetical protein [Bacteroidota bacterium]